MEDIIIDIMDSYTKEQKKFARKTLSTLNNNICELPNINFF